MTKKLFYNGDILTLEDELYAEAVLVEDGKIKAVGKKEELTNHNFKMGDYVTHKKNGKKMKVVGVKNNRITCDRGWFSGITSYDASELEPYKE